jgi:hypothetical protein
MADEQAEFQPEQWLLDAGFTYDQDEHEAHVQTAAEIGMHAGGEYKVHGVYSKGRVLLKVEENTDTQDMNGLKMQVTHPPVCLIYGPKGTVAAPLADRELVLRMADELG